MESRLDIIIFGASGYTGQYTIPYMGKLTKTYGRALSWGIAGRSKEKLQHALDRTAKKTGEDLSNTPIIIADVNDEESLKRMTGMAKIIVNCAGPFILYGEPVVRACLATGTHYVDVSGEPFFVEGLELRYRKAAEEKGLYMVSSCGFHSLLADLGINFLESKFNGTLNSIDMFIHISRGGQWDKGYRIGSTIWLSVITSLSYVRKCLEQRKLLHPSPLPKLNHQHHQSYSLGKREDLSDKWVVPFISADCDAVKRSQRYFYEQEKKRPVQVGYYAFLDSFKAVLIALFLVLFVGIPLCLLSQFGLGRKILLKYPNFFLGRYFDPENPSEEELEQQSYSFTFRAAGWREKLAESGDDYQTAPDRVIVGKISGTNPGYGITCLGVVLCGIIILTEPENLPKRGGVYTPAVAFAKTTLIEQLQQNGLKFEIVKSIQPRIKDGGWKIKSFVAKIFW